MAMNLRLPNELAEALRALAEETGRSQQDLTREALSEYIRGYHARVYPPAVRHLITPARQPDTGAPGWPDIDGEAVVAALLRDRRSSRW
jgi:hypothetical protein